MGHSSRKVHTTREYYHSRGRDYPSASDKRDVIPAKVYTREARRGSDLGDVVSSSLKKLNSETALWSYDAKVQALKNSKEDRTSADFSLERRISLRSASPCEHLLLYLLKNRKYSLFNDKKWGSLHVEMKTERPEKDTKEKSRRHKSRRDYCEECFPGRGHAGDDIGEARSRGGRGDSRYRERGRDDRGRKSRASDDKQLVVKLDIKLPIR